VAFVALALSACTTVTTVRVTPEQLHTLAAMGPNDERRFEPVNDTEKVAHGNDEIRLLFTPTEGGLERGPSVTQAPWAKLYTLRWQGDYVTLTPIDHSTTLTVPAGDLTGAQVKMDRYSGSRTAGLVIGIVGGALSVALVFLALSFVHGGGG
jgi:hypothetical protein